MFKLDLKEGKHPIIIKPNLGQPELINLRDFKRDNGNYFKKIIFEALIIAVPKQSVLEILQYFHLNLYIQPILKDDGIFLERRGDKYPIQVVGIKRIKKLDFRDQGVLNDENCIIWDIFNSLMQVDNIFGERKNLYKIKIQIKNIKAIKRLIKEFKRNFILFDIIHDLPNRIENKINYHSIALFDKDWADFKFIHATDFHIARRNDFLSKFLKEKAINRIKINKSRKRKISKNDNFIFSKDFEFKEEFQDHRLEDLRYAKYNFNFNMRMLINYINERVKENKLDFVLITGDLIDYIDIARGNYQYKNNFYVFIEILLGVNRGLNKPPYLTDDEYINKKEIISPIFTIVGNHDYRKGHYSMRVGKIRKIFGMTKGDIKGYYDIKFFNYLKALRSRDHYLKDYFIYLNPNLNYKVKIGKHYYFIFIETGQDSIADMHDLLKGAPSTKGLKDYQVDLLRAYIRLSHNEKIVIIMHTPPLSPNLGTIRRRRLKKKFKIKRKLEWSDLYERNLEDYIGDSRLDRIINLKYQTIMYNWDTFLKICTGSDKIIKRKIDLCLCGHTHTLKEFRLKEAKKDELTSISRGFYFFKIPIKVPCEVYTSRYRDVFKSFKDPMDLKIWFDVNKPFVFQTQAIGPISLKEKFKPPGFRYITVKNNQITRLKVYSLHLKD